MALTRNFKETIKARADRDPAFRKALLAEGIECLLSGDVETGKTILRDYIKATIGFQKLAEATDKQPESIMRMFGPKGNPSAENMFSVLKTLQANEGIAFQLRASRAS